MSEMTLQDVIRIATPIIQSLVDDDIHFGDDDSECFSVILSAAEAWMKQEKEKKEDYEAFVRNIDGPLPEETGLN